MSNFSTRDAIDCGFNTAYSHGSSLTYLCGSKTVIGGFKQCGNQSSTNTCGRDYPNEEYQQANIEYKSNSNKVNISISNDFNSDTNSYFRSFGIREFVFYVYECMPQCAGCTNDTSCSSCYEGYYLKIDNCLNCINQCQKCTDGISCKYCKRGYFYNDSLCVSLCPKGKYPDDYTRTCKDCNNKCATCSNATDCDTCFGNRVAPACECPADNYDSFNYTLSCIGCSTIGCSICNATTCQACLSPYFLDVNSCVKVCPPGKWGNTANRQCTACLAKCATCSNATDCDTCFGNRVAPACECPADNYDNFNYTLSCIGCSTISIGCSICNATTCQACLSPYFLDVNSCVKVCPPGKWGNTANRQCTACLAKCVTCSNANDCDTCFGNRIAPACECPAYNYDNLNYALSCIGCSTISIGCSICNATTCQACLSPYFLDVNSCVKVCPPGKWGNTANRQCTACLAKCETCSNANDCDTCFENRVPQQCNCPQYSYNPNVFNQACTMCSTFSTGCTTCSSIECLTCETPQYFQLNQNKQCDSCLTIMAKIYFNDDLLSLIIDFGYYYSNLKYFMFF
ncbi:leishmanolysin family protein, putative [Ichthyophthirius multifiliis]|uniref:Leishmanolysin family protein, putative n=1 Tax=Ichthyophthirius multifiliis TaxID=5932 RepID=G0QJZ1_ICHMU|nr:leishmanolysin family protein, putative [Ichthyophthirius multifiliis]EGR34451.1 leishmanolysin family protein, putative [Ichthyophthirius multifiliis]|eukprot:XP_004039755.1 leishmanolysin family protein, putative [Ichthyophthirius multifiliis]